MPAAVVVALDYEGGYADTMRLRERDFTPWKFGTGPAEGGGADRYLDFFERELIPRVEAAYRVDPGDRTLAGHSYGGLFSLYAFARRPGLFNRYLAASPSVDRRLLDYVAHGRAPALPTREIRLDVSCGGDELAAEPEDAALLRDLKAAIGANAAANHLRLATRYAVYADQTHGSVRAVSFNYGLAWLFGSQPGSRQTLEFRAAPGSGGSAPGD
jgi:predicted alpha/beta superfamily hydrolase